MYNYPRVSRSTLGTGEGGGVTQSVAKNSGAWEDFCAGVLGHPGPGRVEWTQCVVWEFPDGGRNVAFDDSKIVIRREQDLMKTIFWDKSAGMRPGDTRMTSCSLVQL